ncbi:MAG: hypothetical protein KMY54_04125 [Erysipelothrix sp.]|nr:hypothetical protein [Erysipelothrix sp.]
MKRYTIRTKLDKTSEGYALLNDIEISDILKRLEEFENYYEDLLLEHSSITEQLRILRESDKVKTVSFKQLFANKVMIEMHIERLHRYITQK